MKPHCPDFRPSPTASWLCKWWDWEHIGPDEIEWFCSMPAWDYRECESKGQRNIPEDALRGPIGINVARLLDIYLSPIRGK